MNRDSGTILQKRALELARPLSPDKDGEEIIEVLEFMISREKYACETSFISEVCRLQDFAPLPGVPPFVLGIINLRGSIVSVVDLGRLFGFPEKRIGDLDRVIILKNESMEFGILSDAITGTRSVEAVTLQRHLPTLTGYMTNYLKGITPDGLIVLDGGRILSDEAIIVNETDQE